MIKERTMQHRKAAYVHAVGEALAQVPATDRESILEDLEEHIDDALRAAGMEPGIKQLEQVLSALGSPQAYAADLSLSPPTEALPPKLCKKAAIGLLWSLAFLFVAVPSWLTHIAEEEGAPVSLGERLFQALAFLSLAGGIGGPVVSGIALTQIRHSAGRLIGLGMAVVGVWLLPALVTDVFAFWLLTTLVETFARDGQLFMSLQALSVCLILTTNVVFLLWMVRRQRRSSPVPSGISPQPES